MLISLHELVNKYNIKFNGILHVGAHECEELDDYKKYISIDKILWIEAITDKVNLCKSKYPEINIENAIVSDKIENIVFKVSNNGQSSSMLDFGLHSEYHPYVHYITEFNGTTSLLKDILPKYNINYNFLNFDIQGAELKALKGMEDYLHNVNYLYTEVNSDYVYKDCALICELDEYLKNFGLVRVETKWTEFKWGDAFYIKSNLLSQMKVAICYWGMTRSTRFVYESHINKLFNILKSNNVDYDIFMHTWKPKNDENLVWKKKYDIPIDYEEYKLLNPDYYKIDNQSDFKESLNFSDYFKQELFDKYGGDTHHEWRPYLVLNLLCGLESQKRVYNMVINSKNNYDFIIFMRPDVDVLNDFDIKWLSTKFDIIMPDYEDFGGCNDRFAIIPFNNAVKYAERIDEAKEFRENNSRLAAEPYLKFIVDKYYSNPGFVNFNFKIKRPDNTYA